MRSAARALAVLAVLVLLHAGQGSDGAPELSAQTAQILEAGHADVGIDYEAGNLLLNIHDETSGSTVVQRSPGQTILYARSQSQTTVPSNPSFSFLGNPGDPIWILPQTQNSNLLWLGWNTEDIPTGIFTGNTVSWRLIAVEGPGDFFLYTVGSTGQVTVLFNSKNGIDGNDVVTLSVPSHAHGNWAFNAQGIYRVYFEATATRLSGSQPATSGVVAYHFQVVLLDSDLDWAPDHLDNCPLVPNPDQRDMNGNGIGNHCDPDTDGDGIPNDVDPNDDGDGVLDADEVPCASDPLHDLYRPERIDGAFQGKDDNGNGLIDEPLPPGAGNNDCDGDGYSGAREAHIFGGTAGRDQDPCGTDAWPSDFLWGGIPDSTNRVTLLDLTSFLGPVRHLNTNVGDNPGNFRWDLMPGKGPLPQDININDLTSLIGGGSGHPPMLNGARAFGGPPCPWAP
jgi:surface-anchored protein